MEEHPLSRPPARLLKPALLLLSLPAALLLFEAGFHPALAAARALRAALAGPGAPLEVYIIGESTAAGEPYSPKVSFPAIVSHMYGGRLAGRELRLVNLAEPGSDLEAQYWKLLRAAALRPAGDGLLLVYSGINEAAPDDPDPGFGRWRPAQGSLVLSRLLSFPASSGRLFGQYHTIPKYEYRLRRTLRLARRLGLRPVVSTLAGNLADFPSTAEPSLSDTAGRKAWAEAGRLAEAGRHREAAALYRALAGRAGGDLSGLHYRLGRSLAGAGNYRDALAEFRLAADRGWNHRPTTAQNLAVKRAAEAEGAVLADAAGAFEEASPRGLPGYALFADAHHPNLRGYALLARVFAGGVAAALGVGAPARAPTEEEIKAFSGFTQEDAFLAEVSRVKWFCGMTSLPGNSVLLPKAEEYLAAAERSCRGLGRARAKVQLDLARLLVSASRRDGAAAARLLREGGFLGPNIGELRNGNPVFEGWVFGLLRSAGLPPDAAAELERAAGR